jgi:hypothetical protein
LFKIDKTNRTSNDDDLPGKLINGGDITDQTTKYCAVSHVWGSVDHWNFRSDGNPFPWKVPATSREKVTDILNICGEDYDYVWFDILCIHQGDSPNAIQEKASEMMKMKQYYERSDTTIVFGECHKTFADCWDKVDTLLSVWEKDKGGRVCATRQAVWDGLGAIDKVVSNRWFWRVWTLQETILPRILRTSTKTLMRVDLFCDLIDWTYNALGVGTLHKGEGSLEYDWIHPRAGVVNDHGWWKLSQGLTIAKKLGKNLHPLAALGILTHRQSYKSKDRLFGAYGLIDSKWHVPDRLEYELDDVWTKTVAIYISGYNLAPLLAMAVTTKDQMTWAAGNVDYIGKVVTMEIDALKNFTGNT